MSNLTKLKRQVASLGVRIDSHFYQWLNRKPPFGKVLLASVDTFPRCSVSITDLGIQKQTAANRPVISSLEIRCSAEVAMAFKTTGPRSRPGTVSILTCTSDLAFLDYRRIS